MGRAKHLILTGEIDRRAASARVGLVTADAPPACAAALANVDDVGARHEPARRQPVMISTCASVVRRERDGARR